MNNKNEKYKCKEWLENKYKIKTTREIANECNTNHQKILRWLKKFNIPTRHGKESRLNKVVINPNVDYNKKYRNKEWLENEYKTKTVQQIANENNISKTALLKWFKKFDIQRRNRYIQKSKLENINYFKKIDSSIKAYWLGFLMADGANSNETIEMKLSIQDLEHLELFKKDIKWNGKISIGENICNISKYKTMHKWCHISIKSKILSKDLIKFGIIPNKTGKEKFPNIPEKYYSDFIRGYFDGDGTYTYSYRLNKNKYNTLNSSIKIVCMNENFLKEIKNILVKYANIKENKIHIYYNKTVYSLEIQSNYEILNFYNYIYPKYCRRYLKRKKYKFDETISYILNHIK